MSKKSPRIAGFIKERLGRRANAHYLGFFDAFNSQRYFEAHEVLEDLWLTCRHGPNGDFHKGLIQLAGAFVHVQKKRPGPAAALFTLAERNLSKYGPMHEHLHLSAVLDLIRTWQVRLQTEAATPVLTPSNAPKITPEKTAFSRI